MLTPSEQPLNTLLWYLAFEHSEVAQKEVYFQEKDKATTSSTTYLPRLGIQRSVVTCSP
jgi:hypothetical protein